MNGVNELTNEIIGAAIEMHRTLHNGHPAPRPRASRIISAISACSAVNMSPQFGPGALAAGRTGAILSMKTGSFG